MISFSRLLTCMILLETRSYAQVHVTVIADELASLTSCGLVAALCAVGYRGAERGVVGS